MDGCVYYDVKRLVLLIFLTLYIQVSNSRKYVVNGDVVTWSR